MSVRHSHRFRSLVASALLPQMHKLLQSNSHKLLQLIESSNLAALVEHLLHNNRVLASPQCRVVNKRFRITIRAMRSKRKLLWCLLRSKQNDKIEWLMNRFDVRLKCSRMQALVVARCIKLKDERRAQLNRNPWYWIRSECKIMNLRKCHLKNATKQFMVITASSNMGRQYQVHRVTPRCVRQINTRRVLGIVRVLIQDSIRLLYFHRCSIHSKFLYQLVQCLP